MQKHLSGLCSEGNAPAAPLVLDAFDTWIPSLDVSELWDESALGQECTDFGDLAVLDSLDLDPPRPELLREPTALPNGLLNCAEDPQHHAPGAPSTHKLLGALGDSRGLGWHPQEPPPQALPSSSQAAPSGPARPNPTLSVQQQRDTLLLRYWQLTRVLQQSKAPPPLSAGKAPQLHAEPRRLAVSWNPPRQLPQPVQSCPEQGRPAWLPNPPYSEQLPHQRSVFPAASQLLKQQQQQQPEGNPPSSQPKRAAQRLTKPLQEQPVPGAAWASHSGTGSAGAAQSCGASLPKRKRRSEEEDQSSQVERALADEREQRRVELARLKSRESSRQRRERAKMYRTELERQNAQLRQDVVRLRGILSAWAAQGTVTPDQALAYLNSQHKQVDSS